MVQHLKYIFVLSSGRSGSRLLAEIFYLSGVNVLFDKIEDNKGLLYESLIVNELNSFIDKERYNLTFNYSKLENYKQKIEELKKWAKELELNLKKKEIETVVIKDPRILYLLPVYEKSFKNSYFIHIVRDGRDFAISKNEENTHYGKQNYNLNFLLALWNYRMELVDSFRNKSIFYEFKFEDLISNPCKEIKSLWEFLKIDKEIIFPEIDHTRKQRYLSNSFEFRDVEAIKWLKKFNYIQ